MTFLSKDSQENADRDIQDRAFEIKTLKPSRYNYSIGLPGGTFIYINFFTLKLIVVETLDIKLVRKILADPNESQKNPLMARWRKIFSENGFIIEDHIDEIDLLKSARHATLTNTKNLSLAILPTLDCNFRCVYCFEKRRPDVMGNEVEEALIRFVENKLERNGRLSVTWYGGRCAYLHHEQGKVQCIGGKHLPEENLLFYYFTKKKQQELEAGREFRTIVEALKNSKSKNWGVPEKL